jgi:hypothetical protein
VRSTRAANSATRRGIGIGKRPVEASQFLEQGQPEQGSSNWANSERGSSAGRSERGRCHETRRSRGRPFP